MIELDGLGLLSREGKTGSLEEACLYTSTGRDNTINNRSLDSKTKARAHRLRNVWK